MALSVHNIDNSGKPGEAKFYDALSRAAENADKWTKESALEVMRVQLEKLRNSRPIPEKSFRGALGSPEGQPADRQGDRGRDEQTPAPQASESLATRERPPPQVISVLPDLFAKIVDAYSADKIAVHKGKSTCSPCTTPAAHSKDPGKAGRGPRGADNRGLPAQNTGTDGVPAISIA